MMKKQEIFFEHKGKIMKAIWSGSLSFGLVNITVKLYSAIAPALPALSCSASKCHSPIVYERWCRHCNKQVSWQDTVKGLKQPDGSYFILTQENLKKLKPERSDTSASSSLLMGQSTDYLF